MRPVVSVASVNHNMRGHEVAQKLDRKIASTVSLTQRQTDLIRKEAKRLEISFGEMARRIFDDWAEKRPGLAAKLYGDASR